MKTRNRLIAREEIENNPEKEMRLLEEKRKMVQAVLKNRYVRIALIGAAVYGIIFVSKYFISTSADAVTAVKKFRNAVRE